MYFLSCFRYAWLHVLFIDALWSPPGKRLTSWLSFVMSNCEIVTFPIGILGQVWCLIVSVPDPWLFYFVTWCSILNQVRGTGTCATNESWSGKHVNLINKKHPNQDDLSTIIILLNPDSISLARDVSNYREKSLDIRKNNIYLLGP